MFPVLSGIITTAATWITEKSSSCPLTHSHSCLCFAKCLQQFPLQHELSASHWLLSLLVSLGGVSLLAHPGHLGSVCNCCPHRPQHCLVWNPDSQPAHQELPLLLLLQHFFPSLFLSAGDVSACSPSAPCSHLYHLQVENLPAAQLWDELKTAFLLPCLKLGLCTLDHLFPLLCIRIS